MFHTSVDGNGIGVTSGCSDGCCGTSVRVGHKFDHVRWASHVGEGGVDDGVWDASKHVAEV